MSFSLHSSWECLGSSKRCSEKDSAIWPVKSSIGEISSKTSASPRSFNQRKESRWIATRSSSSIGRGSAIFAKDSRWERDGAASLRRGVDKGYSSRDEGDGNHPAPGGAALATAGRLEGGGAATRPTPRLRKPARQRGRAHPDGETA